MSAQILLFEDDAVLRDRYVELLRVHGFDDIAAYSDTTDAVALVRSAYDRPTVLVSDYFIHPLPPTVVVPELRRLGLDIPVIVMSSKVRFELLSELNMRYRLSAFLAKGSDSDIFVARLSAYLMELQHAAIEAWTDWQLLQEARPLVERLTAVKRRGMLQLLSFAEPKGLIIDGELKKDAVYELQALMMSFVRVGDTEQIARRYAILHRVLRELCSVSTRMV